MTTTERRTYTSHSYQPLILFDGVCELCNGLINRIIKADRKKVFRFSTIQKAPQELRDRIASLPDSIILFDANEFHSRSNAVLRIANRLPYPWKIVSFFQIIPESIRDVVYSIIARNRYRWFGIRDECMLPTAEIKDRFLS